MQLKRAIGGYIRGTYKDIIELTLLREAPYCNTCRGCVYDSGMRYRYCWFNWEILPAFDKAIGAECPVEWRLDDES